MITEDGCTGEDEKPPRPKRTNWRLKEKQENMLVKLREVNVSTKGTQWTVVYAAERSKNLSTLK